MKIIRKAIYISSVFAALVSVELEVAPGRRRDVVLTAAYLCLFFLFNIFENAMNNKETNKLFKSEKI